MPSVTHHLTPGRVATFAAEAFACLLAFLALVVLVRQVLIVALTVTVSTPGTRLYFALLPLPPLELPRGRVLLFYSAILLAGSLPLLIRIARARGVSASLFAAQILLGFVALAHSYRLPALLALVSFIILRPRTPALVPPRSPGWLALTLVVLLALLPVDISLQAVPGPPRFVPAVSGLLAGSAFRHAAEGQFVIVGSCIPVFNQPTWVWVW